jgi:hypothetical protein
MFDLETRLKILVDLPMREFWVGRKVNRTMTNNNQQEMLCRKKRPLHDSDNMIALVRDPFEIRSDESESAMRFS